MSIIFPVTYFENQCMEYFLFFSLFRGGGESTSNACKVVFYLYLTLGGLFFQEFIGFIRKNPLLLLYFLQSWDVLVFLEPLGTGRSG